MSLVSSEVPQRLKPALKTLGDAGLKACPFKANLGLFAAFYRSGTGIGFPRPLWRLNLLQVLIGDSAPGKPNRHSRSKEEKNMKSRTWMLRTFASVRSKHPSSAASVQGR